MIRMVKLELWNARSHHVYQNLLYMQEKGVDKVRSDQGVHDIQEALEECLTAYSDEIGWGVADHSRSWVKEDEDGMRLMWCGNYADPNDYPVVLFRAVI